MAAEIIRADGQHGGEADGRIHGVAAADPIPEAEHVGGIDAELGYFRGVGGHRDEVLGHGFFIAAQTRQRPGASRVGVGHGFERRECFRGNDEERLRRVEIADRFGEIGAIDVGNEAERHGAVAVMLQRLVGHHRAEVGAADADVDDVANALAGVSLPFAAADAVARIPPSCRARRGPGAPRSRRPPRWMRPLGARRATCSTARFSVTLILSPRNMASMCERRPDSSASCDEQLEGFVGDAVLRVVEEDARGLGRHPLAALGVVRE